MTEKENIMKFPKINNLPKIPRKHTEQVFKVNLSTCKHRVVFSICKELKWSILVDSEDPSDCDLYWSGSTSRHDFLFKLNSHQLLNFFPGMFSIARKSMLCSNFKKMSAQFPDQYNFHPLSFILPFERQRLIKEMQMKKKSTWIVKPDNSSEGKGIYLASKIEDIKSDETVVVQEYISSPMLIDGHKFDLRIYVLITSVVPLRLYIYHKGIARFAAQPYSAPSRSKTTSLVKHLTNYALNKEESGFDCRTKKEDGGFHKRTLEEIYIEVEKQGGSQFELKDKIKSIILKTIIMAQPLLEHIYRTSQPDDLTGKMCFELLGFDIIIREDFEPLVLEVNHGPSLTTETPFDEKLKKGLLTDTFKLIQANVERRNNCIRIRKERAKERFQGKVRQSLNGSQKEISKSEQVSKDDELAYSYKSIFEPIHDHGESSVYNEFLQFSRKMHLRAVGINDNNIKRRENKPSNLPPVHKKASSVVEKPQKTILKMREDEINKLVMRLFSRADKLNLEAKSKLELIRRERDKNQREEIKPSILNLEFLC